MSDAKPALSTRLKGYIRPLVALIFLIILIKKGPFKVEQIKFILSQPKIIVLGFVMIFMHLALSSIRWKVITETVTTLKLKLAFMLTLIGLFFSFFIPGGVGGDLVKAVELTKSTGTSRKDSLSTVVADRLLGLYSMVSFSTVFLLIEYFHAVIPGILKYLAFSGFLFLAMTAGLLFGPLVVHTISKIFGSHENKLIQFLEKLIKSFSLTFACVRTKEIFAKVIGTSFIMQLISQYFMFEVIKALGAPAPSFFLFFSLSCFGFLASAIPITPAGIGVGQAAFYFLFSAINPELGNAAVTAVSMLQLFQFFYALIGGVLFSTKPLFKFDTKELQ